MYPIYSDGDCWRRPTLIVYCLQFWDTDQSYSTPETATNKCTQFQKSGFNWASLPNGTVSTYGGFKFTGFVCGSASSSSGATGIGVCYIVSYIGPA